MQVLKIDTDIGIKSQISSYFVIPKIICEVKDLEKNTMSDIIA